MKPRKRRKRPYPFDPGQYYGVWPAPVRLPLTAEDALAQHPEEFPVEVQDGPAATFLRAQSDLAFLIHETAP